MAAIITNKFRINNAEQFVESFSETAATTYYLFIGRDTLGLQTLMFKVILSTREQTLPHQHQMMMSLQSSITMTIC